MRCIARQTIELGDRNASLRAVGLYRFDDSIERAHGHRHIAWMARDAGVAHPHYRMWAAEPANRRAAAAGVALIAGLVGVIEIGAACALKQVARGGRLV